MKVLVRQISTGLYWKSGVGWVKAEDAEIFQDSASALLYCVRKEMRDVHLILCFDDPRYDVVMCPFGKQGNRSTSSELIAGAQALSDQNKEVTERTKALLAGAHQTLAEFKERKKKQSFKRKRIAEKETD